MLTLQAGAREMISHGQVDRLLATAPISGLRGEKNAPSTAYAATKGAVISLMRAISMQVAGLFTYLASNEAAFITGTTFRIDGGELAI